MQKDIITEAEFEAAERIIVKDSYLALIHLMFQKWKLENLERKMALQSRPQFKAVIAK